MRDLRFVLWSRDHDALRAQRIMGFLILIAPLDLLSAFLTLHHI